MSDRIDDVYELAYEELKRLAHRHLSAGRGADTLSTTELVHEAYLKLTRSRGSEWDSQAHFFGAAARAMRQVLVDFARRRTAAKRGGEAVPLTLRSSDASLEVEIDDLLALDAALDKLDAADRRLREVVELRFFAGLSESEIAGLLAVTLRTVERDWAKARLFLLHELDVA